MNRLVNIILLLVPLSLFAQKNHLYVWDNNLEFIDEIQVLNSIGVENPLTYKELFISDSNDRTQIILAYYGSEIKNPKEYEFAYNAVYDFNNGNFSQFNNKDIYFFDNEQLNYYDTLCKPRVDSLADGVWLSISMKKNIIDIVYYKTIKNNMFDGRFFLDDINLTIFYKNGVKLNSVYNRLGTFIFKEYNDCGWIKELKEYRFGKLIQLLDSSLGVHYKIHPEGETLQFFGKIINELPEGKYSYFDNNGELKKTILFKKGIPIEVVYLNK